MNNLTSFFSVLVTAAIVENVVFARALGTSKLMDRTRETQDVLSTGGALTLMSALATLCNHQVSRIEAVAGMRAHYRALVYLACISVVYMAVCLMLRKFWPGILRRVGGLLSGVAFSGALLGLQIIALNEYSTLFGRLAYAIGGTLGLVVALLMIMFARERLSFSRVPSSFRGLPILLIYIGILSLAIYGLIGHPLAA